MLSLKMQDRVLELSKALIDLPDGKNRHFSFFCKRNKILSIGWNSYTKSHPLCFKMGYQWGYIHSEMSCLLNYRKNIKELIGCTLINVRVNTMGLFGISKPCETCSIWLPKLQLEHIYYTDFNGEFAEFHD